MKSLDDESRLEAERIARTLPESFWVQSAACWLAQSPSPPRYSFRDKEEFIEKWVLGARALRDNHRIDTDLAYKAIDPTHQTDQLITLSFDKAEFRSEMVEQVIRSLRQKCPKVLDYDEAIARPEFSASVQTDPSFNPHIHIYTPKVVKESAVCSAFTKRFVSCKKKTWPVYNVNVVSRPHPAHFNYVRGLKIPDKKVESMRKDAEYRKSHNIAETYQIAQ